MNLIRKATKNILVACLLITCIASSNVNANNIKTNPLVSSSSEYQFINNLQAKSDEELLADGLTESQIEELRSLDYIGELKKRASLDDSNLRAMGYTDQEIVLLRNLDNNCSEDILNELSADLKEEVTMTENSTRSSDHSGYLSANGSGADEERSNCWVQYGWEWSKVPLFRKTEAVAISWTDGMKFDPKDAECKLYYYYEAAKNGFDIRYESYTDTVDVQGDLDIETKGCHAKFDMLVDVDQYYVLKGYLNVHLFKQELVKEINIQGAYGHSILFGTPSVSFPFGASITFGSQVEKLSERTDYEDLVN